MSRFSIFSLVFAFTVFLALVAQGWAQESGPTIETESTPTPAPTPAPIVPQIVGGGLASLNEYPWQVAIVDAFESNPQLGQFCGGSLIDTEWVLTAAHCVVNNGSVTPPGDIDVVLGILNLSSGPTNGATGQRINVAEVIPFPGFDEITFDKDVALLRLATPASLGSAVNTIGLVGPENSALVVPGTQAVVTGWGATSEGGAGSNALREVTVPIVSTATCNAPSSYNGEITGNMFCAGLAAGGKDSCQGDSGGPLVVPNGANKILAGVVSWGNGCAQPNFYGVYTKLAQFKGWIELEINGPSNFLYLPFIINICKPIGESNNISNALTVTSGQKVCGQVSDPSDLDDVYKIFVPANRTLTISLTGAGGDADLYLFGPSADNVNTDTPIASSATDGNNEFIQGTILTTGFWYIDIYAYSGTTSYNVKATISSAATTNIQSFNLSGNSSINKDDKAR